MEFQNQQTDTGQKQPKSLSQIIYESYQRGEITQPQMQTMIALRTADTLIDHPARPYPSMSKNLEEYIEKRFRADASPRDSFYCVKNGEWIEDLLKLRTLNQSDVSHLVWSHKLCSDALAEDKAMLIMDHLSKHLENAVPNIFEKALEVQRKDLKERPFKKNQHEAD